MGDERQRTDRLSSLVGPLRDGGSKIPNHHEPEVAPAEIAAGGDLGDGDAGIVLHDHDGVGVMLPGGEEAAVQQAGLGGVPVPSRSITPRIW